MEIIDFVNKTNYTKESSKDNEKSHPKMFAIAPNGTIYLADTANDGKYLSILGNNEYLENHVSYMNVLIENYFSDNLMLLENAKKKSLSSFYENLLEFVKEGYIFFNNMTTYIGPMYSKDRLLGQLLIPKEITPEQQDSLKEVNSNIAYFKEIVVTEFTEDNSYEHYESGATAIPNYLERNKNGKKIS